MSVQEDKALQRFLAGDDPVSQAYRDLPGDEPPAALDARILESARNEAKRPVRPRWFVPVSVAATVVLGVGFSVKQLSTPMESVSDIAYAPVAQESAVGAKPRRPATSVPAPKPNLDVLFEVAPSPQVRMKKIEVDAESLRKQALSSQSFDMKLDPGTLGISPGSASAGNDDDVEFALVPPVQPALPSREQVASAVVEAEPSPSPAPPAAADSSVNWEARQDNADLARAIEERRRRAEELESRAELGANFNSAQATRSQSKSAAQFANEPQAVVVSGVRATDKEVLSSARAQALIDQQLNRIRRQWRLGRTDEARVLFDAFIEDYPDYPLPEDFPLQRPEPEDAP